jgi:hypothetical protein
MTVSAYQTLYESSVAFGMRKALMAEQRKNELKAKVCRGTQMQRMGVVEAMGGRLSGGRRQLTSSLSPFPPFPLPLPRLPAGQARYGGDPRVGEGCREPAGQVR